MVSATGRVQDTTRTQHIVSTRLTNTLTDITGNEIAMAEPAQTMNPKRSIENATATG